MFFYQNDEPSPLQRIEDKRLEAHQVHLYLKRDDLLHPSVSGNKFRKLKYNLFEIKRLGKKGLVTLGGAFSNHIHAAAAAGQLLGIPTVGIVRGERPSVLNPTLVFAENAGMALHFVTRTAYRDKDLIIKDFETQYPDYYWLPEGGSNTLALKGAAEIVPEVISELGKQPDYICLACGTGGTTAGIVSFATTLPKPIKVLGFAILKGDFLEKDIFDMLQKSNNTEGGVLDEKKDWSVNSDYHFGGYAKWSMPLLDFLNDFKRKHGIPLDPIYTGKMLFGIFDLVEKGFFPKNTTIVAMHTGGLQGIDGFNERFGKLIE